MGTVKASHVHLYLSVVECPYFWDHGACLFLLLTTFGRFITQEPQEHKNSVKFTMRNYSDFICSCLLNGQGDKLAHYHRLQLW